MGRLLLADGLVDLDRGEVVRERYVQKLTATERELLIYLGSRAGRDVSRDELHQQVWGHGAQVISRAADFAVHRLRRKIEVNAEDPRHLITASAGYRWVPATPGGAVGAAETVVLLVGETTEAGDAPWLVGCARIARERDLYVVDLSPDRVVVSCGTEPAGIRAAEAIARLGPVRLGLARGPADLLVDPVSGRTLFGGPVYRLAASLARAARPGDVPSTAAVPGGAAPEVARRHLPVRADPFVGRQEVLERLTGEVTRGARLLGLVGPAGAGKSRLAEVLATRLDRDGWVVPLDRIEVDDEAVAVVGRSLALPGGGNVAERIGEALATRGPVVLVLDGIERLANPGPWIAAWLDAAPELIVVVTSRERPRFDGASVTVVGGLPVDDGVALLRDRCPDLPPSAALAELVRRLDGLPLALQLVAPRLRVLGVGEVLVSLDRMLDVLSGPGRTMRAVLGDAWERLDRTERAALVHTTVFAGGFGLSDAEQVLQDRTPGARWFVDVLQVLCDRHWVHVDEPGDRPGVRRFRLLATVRAFATEQGDREPSLLGDAVRAHAVRFASLVDTLPMVGPPPFGPEVVDDLLVAAHSAVQHGWATVATRAVGAAGEAVLAYGSPDDALSLIEPVLALRPTVAERARLDHLRSRLLHRLGRVAEALGCAEQVVQVARTLGDRDLEGRAELQLGVGLRALGQSQEALLSLERALLLVDNPDAVAALRVHQAISLHELSRHEEALERVRTVLEHPPTELLGAHAASVAGVCELELGRLELAGPPLERAIATFERLGATFQVANTQTVLATVLVAQGRTELAAALLRGVLVALQELGGVTHVVVVYTKLASIALIVGDPTEASRCVEEARPWVERTGDQRVRGALLAVRAEVRGALGDPAGAERDVAEARALLEASGDRLMLQHLAVHRGFARLYAGDLEGAAEALARAESGARELEVRPASILTQELRRLRRALRDARR